MPELADRIPGEIILASYNNQQRDRLVERYVDATARSVATPLPVAGTVSYLTATGVFSIFDGATWVDFIDVRGNQQILSALTVTDTLFLGNRINFTLANQRIDVNSEPRVRFAYEAGVVTDESVRIEIPLELGSGNAGTGNPDAVDPRSAIIVNGGGVLAAAPRLQLIARASSSAQLEPDPWGQIALIAGDMALDAENQLRLCAPTASAGSNVLYSVATADFTGQLSSDDFHEIRWQVASGEQFKDINSSIMTKQHGHHPVHLLDVEFKRWAYKPGYLEAGDPREGEDYFAPTAQSMEGAYPFAVDYDADGNPHDLNNKILTEGLLWLVQDLSKRLEALETA